MKLEKVLHLKKKVCLFLSEIELMRLRAVVVLFNTTDQTMILVLDQTTSEETDLLTTTLLHSTEGIFTPDCM